MAHLAAGQDHTVRIEGPRGAAGQSPVVTSVRLVPPALLHSACEVQPRAAEVPYDSHPPPGSRHPGCDRPARAAHGQAAGTATSSAASSPTLRAAEAQQAEKVWRVGYLMSGSAVPETFRRRLRQHGYVEGKNLILGARGMDLRLERLPDLAEELVRLGVDVIATQTTPAALAATAGELKVRGDGRAGSRFTIHVATFRRTLRTLGYHAEFLFQRNGSPSIARPIEAVLRKRMAGGPCEWVARRGDWPSHWLLHGRFHANPGKSTIRPPREGRRWGST
jgi:hypothetical protein